MASFTKQLAKGFVRAAVNQVGRDGGRVISNQIYNGKNYVPVAEVLPNQNMGTIPPPQQTAIPAGAYSTTKQLTTGKIILFVALSLFLFPLGTIGVLIYGIVKIMDKMDTIEWVEEVPQFVQDRRYKTGSRFAGNALVKHKQKVMATPEVAAINKRNGIIAISIAIIFALLIGVPLLLK